MDFDRLLPDNFSGVVSVMNHGEIVFRKAFGYADLANRIRNDVDTKFATASAGKVFVAVAILQLIEKGMLHFDDRLGDVLDFDLKKIDGNITTRQLLNHTSGIPDYFDETVMKDYDGLWKDYPNYKIRSSMDLLPLFIDKPMMYPAGERFQYNNSGYVVLGLIIEKITGLYFDEYLRSYIFEPCNMASTGYYELDRLPAKCADSYIFDKYSKVYYKNIYSVDVKGTGAGGAFTTLPDIDKFWTALLNGKLISNNMIRFMLSPHAFDGKHYYGYGIWLEKTEADIYLPYFEGCDPGVSFLSFFNTQKEYSISAVSNFGHNVWEICRNIKMESTGKN
ncbi:MAG: serine hydrolase [Anaerocolumna sp.]